MDEKLAVKKLHARFKKSACSGCRILKEWYTQEGKFCSVLSNHGVAKSVVSPMNWATFILTGFFSC